MQFAFTLNTTRSYPNNISNWKTFTTKGRSIATSLYHLHTARKALEKLIYINNIHFAWNLHTTRKMLCVPQTKSSHSTGSRQRHLSAWSSKHPVVLLCDNGRRYSALVNKSQNTTTNCEAEIHPWAGKTQSFTLADSFPTEKSHHPAFGCKKSSVSWYLVGTCPRTHRTP